MLSRDIPSVVKVESEQANLLLPTILAPTDDRQKREQMKRELGEKTKNREVEWLLGERKYHTYKT